MTPPTHAAFGQKSGLFTFVGGGGEFATHEFGCPHVSVPGVVAAQDLTFAFAVQATLVGGFVR
jgi:hypothetical protein